MTIIDEIENTALEWLAQQGAGMVSLRRMTGYTNHVFLVQQAGEPDSVLRLARHELSAAFCPLAHDAGRICKIHQQVAELGLAPDIIATDIPAGIMWLDYGGEPHHVAPDNGGGLRDMLCRLHDSGFHWDNPGGQEIDGAGLRYLEQLAHARGGSTLTEMSLARAYAKQLYQVGELRGYADYPLVPVHSDLNPGNCLYNKVRDRWSIIDWDFAGMRAAEWDYASLIVEHNWRLEAARAFVPSRVSTMNLIWFCAVFALLGWEWHFQNRSGNTVIAEKWRAVEYWFGLL